MKELTDRIVDDFNDMFSREINDEVPTRDEVSEAINTAIVEGQKSVGMTAQELNNLAEAHVENQDCVNIILDDAIYTAFIESSKQSRK